MHTEPRAAPAARPAADCPAAVERAVAAVLTAWFLAVFALGWAGVFGRLPPAAIGVLAAAPFGAVVALWRLHRPFRAFVRSVSLEQLVFLNLWRLPAGALFLHYGALGLLPPLFARNAGWGDVLVGCLVPVALMLPYGRGRHVWFHLVGLADLVLAVGTGLTLALLGAPAMGNVAELPLVLIPLFGVPIAGAVHVVALDRLLRPDEAAGAVAA